MKYSFKNHIAEAKAELANGFLDASRKLRLAEKGSDEYKGYKAQVNQYKKWVKQANQIAQTYEDKKELLQTHSNELDAYQHELADFSEYTDALTADTKKHTNNSQPENQSIWAIFDKNPELANKLYNNPTLEDYQELAAIAADEHGDKAVGMVECSLPMYFWLRKEQTEKSTRRANITKALFRNNIIDSNGRLTEHGRELTGQKEAEEYNLKSQLYNNFAEDKNACSNPLLIPAAILSTVCGESNRQKFKEKESQAENLEAKIQDFTEPLREKKPWSKVAKAIGLSAMCASAFSAGAALLQSPSASAKEVKDGSEVMKTRSDESMDWDKVFGGVGEDYIYSVQQTEDGGYILAGVEDYGTNDQSIWLIKTDSVGNKQWGKTLGVGSAGISRSVQQTPEGGYILTGQKGLAENGKICLIQTNHLGEEQWSKTFGEDGYMGGSVQQTNDDGFIIIGDMLIKTDRLGNEQWNKSIRGVDGQQTSDGGFVMTNSEWDGVWYNNVKLRKVNSNGKEEWNRTFEKGFGRSVRQTNDGGYIIVGKDSVPFGSDTDLLMIKTDSLGNKLWSKTFGGDHNEMGLSVQQTSDGGYITTGSTNSYGYLGEDSNGNSIPNVWVIKTDDMGKKQWSKTFGYSHTYDRGSSIKQTLDGNYIIAGFTSEPYDFEDTDAWLIKISAPESQPEPEPEPNLEDTIEDNINRNDSASEQSALDRYAPEIAVGSAVLAAFGGLYLIGRRRSKKKAKSQPQQQELRPYQQPPAHLREYASKPTKLEEVVDKQIPQQKSQPLEEKIKKPEPKPVQKTDEAEDDEVLYYTIKK